MHVVYRHTFSDKKQMVHGKDAEPLIRRCCTDFAARLNRNIDENHMGIKRTEKGKPFFTDLDLRFSVSNTGNDWFCLMAETECGLDMQRIEPRRTVEIAKRFFLPEEAKAVKEEGEVTFFRIWTRKEALGKMLGTGMFSAFERPVTGEAEDYGLRQVELDGLIGALSLTDKSELSEETVFVNI